MSDNVPNSTSKPQDDSSWWSTAYDYWSHPSKLADDVSAEAADLYQQGTTAVESYKAEVEKKIVENIPASVLHAYRYYSDHSLSQMADDGVGWAEGQAHALVEKAIEVGVDALPDSLTHYLTPPVSVSPLAPVVDAIADAMVRQAVEVLPVPEVTASSAPVTVSKSHHQASTKSAKNSHAENKLPETFADNSSRVNSSPQKINFVATTSSSSVSSSSADAGSQKVTNSSSPAPVAGVATTSPATPSSVPPTAVVVTQEDTTPTTPVVQVASPQVEAVSTVAEALVGDLQSEAAVASTDFSFLNSGGSLNGIDNSGVPLNLATSVSEATEATSSSPADVSFSTSNNNPAARVAGQVASREVNHDQVNQVTSGQVESGDSSVGDISVSHQEISQQAAVVVPSLLTPAEVAASVALAQAAVAVPKNNFSPRVVVSGDSLSNDSNGRSVAGALDVPLHQVASSGEQGSGTNDRGRDRSTEFYFENLASVNSLNETAENDILPQLEGEILERPSSESAFV